MPQIIVQVDGNFEIETHVALVLVRAFIGRVLAGHGARLHCDDDGVSSLEVMW